MTSFTRGLAGLAYHGFASGLLCTQHATMPGSLSGKGGSHILSTLRLRFSRPLAAPTARFFSSALQVRGKGPLRNKAAKNIPTQNAPRNTARPQPATPPTPPPKVKAKPRAAPVASALPRSASGAVSAAAAAGNGFAEQLGRRSISTLLYEAPSHLLFRITSLSAGFCTIAYTIVNYWTIFVYPPENMLWWVPHAFAVICGCMIAGGTYFLMGGVGIVRVIHAIPSARIEALAGKGAAATAARAVKDAGGGPMPPVFLELEIGRVLPILPARKRYILPEKLEVPFRFASYGLNGDVLSKGAAVAVGAGAAAGAGAGVGGGAAAGGGEPLTSYERVKAHEAEKERQAKAREYEMNHLMTAPFRHAGQGARTGWQQVRRVFSREGFIKVIVNGDRQKMDVMGGWALENGRALDRLVSVKNDIK